ncbi:hypothetical protein [Jejuia pallidilutea]|uniref:Glycosyltransferase n=2 Tax=Jejuia pallidilutea TaxID=504487 RepID=A0A090W5R8_9FLAO|nr:hypothetical protein [Jejuia pallidilutea]GAL65904.1 hypothetical protein JCM19301_3589 [Jejuia pallidilutea]GAL71543.1 hypothetical protein JCM19302_1712 [Jejuia pallidilutea]
MYVGLIIVFNDFKNEALKSNFISSINKLKDVKMCLVCNNSSDQVFEILSEIGHQNENTTVVNNKRKKSNTASVKAGARYLYNHNNLKYVGYIVGLNTFEILEELKAFIEYYKPIIEFNQREMANQKIRQTYYQSLFCVSKSLKKINLETTLRLVDSKR